MWVIVPTTSDSVPTPPRAVARNVTVSFWTNFCPPVDGTIEVTSPFASMTMLNVANSPIPLVEVGTTLLYVPASRPVFVVVLETVVAAPVIFTL